MSCDSLYTRHLLVTRQQSGDIRATGTIGIKYRTSINTPTFQFNCILESKSSLWRTEAVEESRDIFRMHQASDASPFLSWHMYSCGLRR